MRQYEHLQPLIKDMHGVLYSNITEMTNIYQGKLAMRIPNNNAKCPQKILKQNYLKDHHTL